MTALVIGLLIIAYLFFYAAFKGVSPEKQIIAVFRG